MLLKNLEIDLLIHALRFLWRSIGIQVLCGYGFWLTKLTELGDSFLHCS